MNVISKVTNAGNARNAGSTCPQSFFAKTLQTAAFAVATAIGSAALAAPVDVYLQTQQFDKEMPDGSTVPMWGYATCDDTFANCTIDAPAGTINAVAGDDLTIYLQNTLGTDVSVMIPGQASTEDGTSVRMSTDGRRVASFVPEAPASTGAGHGTHTYTFNGLKAGTYLYQSGTFPSLQVPMGLYGALVVTDTSDPARDELIVLSEIDPVQNARVDAELALGSPIDSAACISRADYDASGTTGYPCTIDYNPRYVLVNGGATIDLTAPTGAGSTDAILRFANAGLRTHTPSVVNLVLDVIREDGNAYPGSARRESALEMPAGKTKDALVTLPDEDITFGLFDRQPSFRNDAQNASAPMGSNSGGAFGQITVGSGTPDPVSVVSGVTDDTYGVDEDTVLNVAAPGVLSNDSGMGTPTVTTDVSHGTLVFASDGSFDYTPAADFSGYDHFVYTLDGELAHVTLNVGYTNDVPVANADAFSNTGGTGLTVGDPLAQIAGVLKNDADADGDRLTAVYQGPSRTDLTLYPNGAFVYTGTTDTSFGYCADDGTTCSAPVMVTVTVREPSNVALNLVDKDGAAVAVDYKWTVELDTGFQPDATATSDPFDPDFVHSLGTSFHKSYMPVVAQGRGAAEFAELYLDPTQHYYVSVLPLDAAQDAGHQLGGAQIAPGQTSVTVKLNPSPVPTAQISIFVFNDKAPTNGAWDTGEVGLGGFQVLVEDAGGRYGAAAGLLSYDAFGEPLTNALDCFGTDAASGNPIHHAGVITSCPDTPENREAGLVGQILIKNLYPGKYGVITTPRPDQVGDWSQTSTIEGSILIDAWVKANEPPFFQEFGAPGWHVFVGFVNPSELQPLVPNPTTGELEPVTGANSVIGQVTNAHMSRPPLQVVHSSGSYDALAHTRAWIGVNSANGNGLNFGAQQANEDGSFEIGGLPDGDYQLAIWDQYLDQVIAYRSFTVPGAAGETVVDVEDIPVFNWFSRSEHSVFLDTNENGVWDTGEAPLPEQNINLRWRDGTVYQAAPTDGAGEVPFDTVFPFFHWQVAEVDYARYKPTGVSVMVDGGGAVAGNDNGGVLNPQQQSLTDPANVSTDPDVRTETGEVLTQAFQGFLGQTNVFEWGKVEWPEGENGGISGIVYYSSTRAESDPRLGAAEPWEPGIPDVTVRLYRVTTLATADIEINDPAFMDVETVGNVETRTPYFRYLSEGSYTLSADISGATSHRVQLGLVDINGDFIVLGEDLNANPVGGSDSAEVRYVVPGDHPNLGAPLAVRFVTDGSVANATLALNEMGLALVTETTTDSWDNSVPEGCPGADVTEDQPILGNRPLDTCYDGLRNFNQVRPGVFDGGYAFGGIPAGDYVVEVEPPPGYEIVKEEDVNVGFGESYDPVAVPLLFPTGGDAVVPDTATVFTSLMGNVNDIVQPRCAGVRADAVPMTLALLDGPEGPEAAPFAGALNRPLCDRKYVTLDDQGQAAADFFLFTEAPIAAHAVGMILDDLAQEFRVESPAFSEKYAPPFVPVSIQDWQGTEISRVLSDQWGRFNVLMPSTFTASVPSPSGYAPAMYSACMNDPGPIPDGSGGMMVDPSYNPAYAKFCYTFQYMPGTTTYLDTPVVPVAAFAAGDSPADCELVTDTPKIRQVDGNSFGPVVTQGGTLTIYSEGTQAVPNPDYSGPLSGLPKTVNRNYGFGATEGTVTLDGNALTVLSWSDSEIQVTAPGSNTTAQLMVTRGDNGATTENGITVAVVGTGYYNNRVHRVPSQYATIQDAIDAARPRGDTVLVEPGTYNEQVIMYKPVRLQGSGAGATRIDGTFVPTEVLIAWREKMDCLYGIGAGCTQEVNSLPTQPEGADGFMTEEGAPITVVAPFDPLSGPGRPANRFWGGAARIDGFSISGGNLGGGIFVNGYAHQLRISNNVIAGNQGALHGGVRIGRPEMGLPDPETLLGAGSSEYQFNDNVRIFNNIVRQNGGLRTNGGGISLAAGSDRYRIQDNFICGNFMVGNGGGIGHYGLSNAGIIERNTIALNQVYDQANTVSGGGIFIGGEPADGLDLTYGSGTVTIRDNLIQGNEAGTGHGGGVRLAAVNGQDVVDGIPGRFYRVTMQNNVVVNNLAAWGGGGLSIVDAINVNISNNTVAHNDSIATAAPLITVTATTNETVAQPGGISLEVHSPALTAAIPASVNDRFKVFSQPLLRNSIVYQNRQFSYLADDTGARLIPEADAATCTGNWSDVAVLGRPDLSIVPRQSLLTDTLWLAGQPNVASPDPDFVADYCNGSRVDGTGAIEVFPAVDEGGAGWVSHRWGPLKLQGDYHIGMDSAGIDLARASWAPGQDFDGDDRPVDIPGVPADGGLVWQQGDDIGADEYVPLPPPVE